MTTNTAQSPTQDQIVQNAAALLMMAGVPCPVCGRRATSSTSKRRWIGLEAGGEIRPVHVACARKMAQVVATLAKGGTQ